MRILVALLEIVGLVVVVVGLGLAWLPLGVIAAGALATGLGFMLDRSDGA